MRLAIPIALAIATTACGSYTTYRTTRIAPAGHTEWLFGLQAAGAAAPGYGGAPLPEMSIAARRAVGDRYELQANGTMLPLKQLATGSIELAGKVRLLERGRWSLAAGAGAGYRLAASGGAMIETAQVSAPLIGGVELGRHQLVFSVVGGYERIWSSGARPVGIPFVGESLGFVWQVGEHVALFPEIGGAFTPTENFMTSDSRLFHVAFGVLWVR